MDSAISTNGNKLKTVDSKEVSSVGTPVDTSVVGAAPDDAAWSAVGGPDLAASVDSDDLMLASAVATDRFLSIASSRPAASASPADTTSGTTVASGGAAGIAEASILDGGGTVPLSAAAASASASTTSALATVRGPTLTTMVSIQSPSQLIVTPPDQDIWTTSVYSYAPGGGGPGGGLADDLLKVGGWGDLYYSLLEFNLAGLPTTAGDVQLRLYDINSDGGTPTSLNLYQITQSWNWQTQGTGPDRLRLWWADQPTAIPEGSAALPAPTPGSYYYIDITSLYDEWMNGSVPNYGIELRPTNNSDNFDIFASSRNTTQADQPALVFTNPQVSAPTFSISGPGNVTAGKNAVFTVTMKGSIGAPVTIWYSTHAGTASAADGDYANTFVNRALTFNPGGPTSLSITIPTLTSSRSSTESSESFSVGLQSTQFGKAFTSASATILPNGSAGSLANDVIIAGLAIENQIIKRIPNPLHLNNSALVANIASHVATQFDSKYTIDAQGYIFEKGYPDTQQCVALVLGLDNNLPKHTNSPPALGETSWWTNGTEQVVLNGAINPNIALGTPIATFVNAQGSEVPHLASGKGKYPSINEHAAIFLGAGVENNQSGFFMLDQYIRQNVNPTSEPAEVRFIALSTDTHVLDYYDIVPTSGTGNALALLGQYAAAGFATAPDQGGGPLVTHTAAEGSSEPALLTISHH